MREGETCPDTHKIGKVKKHFYFSLHICVFYLVAQCVFSLEDIDLSLIRLACLAERALTL